MLIENKVNGFQEIITPELWAFYQQKTVEHGQPNQKYSSLFRIIDKDATELPSKQKKTITDVDVPKELRIHKGNVDNVSSENVSSDAGSARVRKTKTVEEKE